MTMFKKKLSTLFYFVLPSLFLLAGLLLPSASKAAYFWSGNGQLQQFRSDYGWEKNRIGFVVQNSTLGRPSLLAIVGKTSWNNCSFNPQVIWRTGSTIGSGDILWSGYFDNNIDYNSWWNSSSVASAECFNGPMNVEIILNNTCVLHHMVESDGYSAHVYWPTTIHEYFFKDGYWQNAQPYSSGQFWNSYMQLYLTTNGCAPPESLPTATGGFLNVSRSPMLGELQFTTTTVSSAFPPYGEAIWYDYTLNAFYASSTLKYTPALAFNYSLDTSKYVKVELYDNADLIDTKYYDRDGGQLGFVFFDPVYRSFGSSDMWTFHLSATTTTATADLAYGIAFSQVSNPSPGTGGGGGGTWADDIPWRTNTLCQDPDTSTFTGRLWAIVSTKVPFNFFHNVGCAINDTSITSASTHLVFDIVLPAGNIPVDIDFTFLRNILRTGFIDILFKSLFLISLTFYFWHRIKDMTNAPLN